MKLHTLSTITLLSISFMLYANADEKNKDTPHTKGAAIVAAGDYGYTGGDGSSYEQAIIISGAETTTTGIFMEKFYANKAFPEATLESQRLVRKDKKVYDVLNYTLPNGTSITLYFDITNFFGK